MFDKKMFIDTLKVSPEANLDTFGRVRKINEQEITPELVASQRKVDKSTSVEEKRKFHDGYTKQLNARKEVEDRHGSAFTKAAMRRGLGGGSYAGLNAHMKKADELVNKPFVVRTGSQVVGG